jgi:hypothetical protein
MDEPERFAPTVHGYWRMKLSWIQFADDLPRYDSYTRERDGAVGYPNERQSAVKDS